MIQPRRAAVSAALIAAAALGLLILRVYSPREFRFYPQCVFHQFTGLNCPGCGGTRCMHALLNGRVLEALNDNALIIVFLPFLAVATTRRWWPWVHGRPPPLIAPMKPWLVYTIALTLVAFALLRNLPWAPFCHLSPR